MPTPNQPIDSDHESEPPPLDGVRVIDASRVLAGPYCATLLGLLGAEVIKVEGPGGDECRTWPPSQGEMGSSFMALNLNKRGLVLDLKNPAAIEVFKDLVRSADILVENFKTGEMERFGLGWPVLQKLNSRLIYTSISAFGRVGPKAEDAGYEALVQAYSGAMAITGQLGGEPVRSGVSFLDMSSGAMAALGTVSALLRRGTTGRGGKVEASLLGSAMGLMANHMANYLQHGNQPKRIGTAHPQLVPYQAYSTRDGLVFIATGNQGLWERLCRTLGREELISDPRFGDNLARVNHRDECVTEISTTLSQYDTEPLLKLLTEAKLPCSQVNDFDALLADGQVNEIGVLVSGEDADYGEFRVPGLPFSISGYQPATPKTAPRIGEHSQQLLTELGYSEGKIETLFASGAVI